MAINLAHRVRGTAGSLGLIILSQIAGKIEDALDGISSAGQDAADKPWKEVDDLLAEGQKYISEGLFTKPATEAQQQATAAAGAQAPQAGDEDTLIASKVLFYSKHHAAEKLGTKSFWKGAVHLVVTNDLTDEHTGTVSGGILDAAIIRADDTDELFETARAVRSLPGAATVPLALVGKKFDKFSASTILYAGVSYFMQDTSEKGLQETFEKLMALSRMRKPRILSVEDDSSMTAIIGSILTAEGMLVYANPEPIQTLQAMDEFKPDLVLLDVQMPGLSGYDVCRIIRNSERWSNVPILFLTAMADHEGRSLAFEAGADDFLAKPIVHKELLTRVVAHLDHASKDSFYRPINAPKTDVVSLPPFYRDVYRYCGDDISNQNKFALALIELADFHTISMLYGVKAAFGTLQSMRKLIDERFPCDMVRSTWGEFGFALAFPDATRDAVREAVTALLAEFKQRDPLYAEMASKFSFFSGEAVYPEDGDNLDELLASAGRRLTAARVSGTGAASIAPPKATAPVLAQKLAHDTAPSNEKSPATGKTKQAEVAKKEPEPADEPELVVPKRMKKKAAEPVGAGTNPGPALDNDGAKKKKSAGKGNTAK